MKKWLMLIFVTTEIGNIFSHGIAAKFTEILALPCHIPIMDAGLSERIKI
jgi:hypothetical protein